MSYRVERMYEGCYVVVDEDDDERVARVARFMPGDLVLVEAARITSPALARAIAEAMVVLADELDARRDDTPEAASELSARPAHLRDGVDAAGRTATFSDPDHIIRPGGDDPRDADPATKASPGPLSVDAARITPPEPWSP